MDFAFNLFIILLDIFFAREKEEFGISFVLLMAILGIIIECPLDIGLMSKTAMLSLFSSIFFDGISPSIMDRNMSLFDFEDFDCCLSISSSAWGERDSICFSAAAFWASGMLFTWSLS